MKRNTLWMILLCGLLLIGCGKTDNPYQVDTVVRIPVDPTDAPTAVPAEPEETAALTETEALMEETEPAEATEGKSESTGEKTGSSKKPVSTKKPTSTKKPSSDSKEPEKTTEPAPTEIPETQGPAEFVETEAPAEQSYDPSDYSVGSLEKAILEEMNAYRAEGELSELPISRRLSGIAALRAEEAVEVWSHTRPDGRGYTTAMSDYDYGFSTSAELLIHVSGSADAEAIVAKWMDTDSGNEIMSEHYTTAGIAVFRTGGTTVAAVLLIG